MRLQNYTKRLSIKQLTTRTFSLVQFDIGNIIERCKGIGVSVREPQTHLTKALSRKCINTFLFSTPSISELSDLSHEEAVLSLDIPFRPSNDNNNNQEVII